MIRVLFVDDVEILRDSVRIHLERTCGFIVDTTEPPIIALEKLRDTQFDAIAAPFLNDKGVLDGFVITLFLLHGERQYLRTRGS